MKKQTVLFFPLLFSLFFAYAQSNEQEGILFKYKYKDGDNYRILSTVQEDVIRNYRMDHKGEIVNRISVKVTKVNPDGSAEHDTTFMTSEKAVGAFTGNSFTWGNEYRSIFTRDSKGIYTIGDEYFMPVVRNVPVFPDYPLKPGDKWQAEGHEAHDLRETFGVQEPYKVPFVADYTYNGPVSTKDKSGKEKILHEFDVSYSLYFESPSPENQIMLVMDYPVQTMGFSKQKIYWDAEKGAIDHYGENFRITIATAAGNLYEFRGTAKAEVTEFQRTATEETVAKVQKQIQNLGVKDVSVSAGEKGLTLSIENIQFLADSAVLLDSEKKKIETLAKIIEQYPDNDLLISGHCALAGTAQERQELSEERAAAVADYLGKLGVKDTNRIFTQGFGATKPVAPNNTPQGMAKNRRVEITILDN